MTSVTTATATSFQIGAAGHKKHENPIDTAAKALGMSADDLKAELKDGKSLGDVADEKGVSRDDLAKALKDAAPARLKNSADADSKISEMIDQKGGPQGPRGKGHHQGPPPPPPSSSSSSSSIDSASDDPFGAQNGTLVDLRA